MDSIALPKIPLIPSTHHINPNSRHSFRTLPPLKPSSSLLDSLRSPRPFRSVSRSAALSGSSGGGGGGDGLSGGGDGGDGGGGGEAESRSVAVGESEEVSDLGDDGDVIVLSVEGMSCDGCAASVKRILESQPQVSAATVSFEKETAVVWVVPEVKVANDWRKELGEKLAIHLTTCGFKSGLQGAA